MVEGNGDIAVTVPVTWQVISYPVAVGATPGLTATFRTATTHVARGLAVGGVLGDDVPGRSERGSLEGGQHDVENVLHLMNRFIYPEPGFPGQSQDLAPFPPGAEGC